MSLETAVLALIQAVLFGATGWVVGNYLLTLLERGGKSPDPVGLPERALAAIVGAIFFSIALMLAHIASGGRVFGNPWPVPVAGAAVLIAGVRRRMWPESIPWLRVVAAGAVLFFLFVLPAVTAGSGVRTGDLPWHLGWSNQLLSGEQVPTGPAPEFSRNAYPWAFHAVLVTIVRLVPGSNPLIAHEGLHLLLVGALPLAAASVARLIDRRAGWAAAGAVSLLGGFGWIKALTPRFILTPTDARFGADLVVASPNSMYELFPPAIPRELGLVVLAAAAVLVAHAVPTSRRRLSIAAGLVIGVAGLVNLPLLFIGLLWLTAGLVSGARTPRRAGLFLLAAASTIAAASIWLIPLVVSSLRFGGLLDVSPVVGVEWPLPTALGSWGLLLPLAAFGLLLIILRRRADPVVRVVVALMVATAVLLLIAIARGRAGWTVGSIATVLHQGRVWPAAHLLAAAFGGVGLIAIADWTRRRSRASAIAGLGVVLAVGAVSPVFATIHLTRVMEQHEKGFIYSSADFHDDSFIVQAASQLKSSHVVRVEESDVLGFLLFQFSGARLASYDDPLMAGNDLRIRFADLASGWESRMNNGGFAADYTALRAAEAPAGMAVVARGSYRGESWILVAGDLGGRPQGAN